MDYQSHWLYKEICSMSKEFRASIRHMPIEHRADIGKKIRSTLRKSKYQTYKAIKTNELLNPDDKIKDIKIVDEHTIATINSYLGLMGHYCTYHIRKRLIQNLSVIFGRGFRKVKLNKNLNCHD